MKWKNELDLAGEAAGRAAALLEKEFRRDAGIRSESGRDIKTRADVAAEELIVAALHTSGVPVLAEESAGPEELGAGLHWLVDPLDGTMNFTRDFPVCAVSVALWDGMEPVLGVVRDLSNRVCYTGIVGAGAWRDGVPISVSAVAERAKAVLATGFPVAMDLGGDSMLRHVRRARQYKKVRMIGSAAMSLAYVASGVFDAYIEDDIMLWDVAGGGALVRAAGGVLTVCPGSGRHAVLVSAGNGRFGLE